MLDGVVGVIEGQIANVMLVNSKQSKSKDAEGEYQTQAALRVKNL